MNQLVDDQLIKLIKVKNEFDLHEASMRVNSCFAPGLILKREKVIGNCLKIQ